MRVLRRVLAVLLVLVVVGAVLGYRHYRPLLATGTGYAAHNSCAVTLVAGRDDPDTDLPPNPLVPYLTGYVNLAGKSSTSAVGWLLAKQKAFYTQGYGCTVAGERPAVSRRATKVESEGNPYTDAPAPEADPALEKAMSRAFGDDLSVKQKKDLGTRAVVVLRDGKLVAERYADGFSTDTPQLGWSMAKSATNLLVGRYVLERGLDVRKEDGLRPEWTDERRSITVDQLMRMTSGLRWDETYSLGTPITQMLYAEPDMARYVASQGLAHQPGTYQQYSSGSTNLVCSWLSSLADVPDADFPRTELFAPLGLSSATWETDGVGNPVCSSYLWATPRDWAALGQFALQDGVWGGDRLLPEGWMAQSTTAQPVDHSEERGYAAGWWVNQEADGSLVAPELPADAYWMSGHDGQRVYVVPSQRLVVVRLGFSPEVDGSALRTDALVRDVIAAAPTS
ncbi:serine hydrolase domain-containing protein [Phycicoccus sonneratiae]|uniref:Serine hydrolase n=1 Tax=Phycicoccus sonneratiae TaxID=2807628 RepID=A0ABS2CPE2_9MICO|nr:serine hydrolase [Phycicoccus sonneraticus]MBM6401746.1 serine hydrolase [Phycicoccus sonneraticus]